MILDGLTHYPHLLVVHFQQETNHDQPWAANTKSPVSPRKTTGLQHCSIAGLSMETQDLDQALLSPRLVGGLEHEFYDFPIILGISYSHLTFIFFRGVGQPPTSLDQALLSPSWMGSLP
jgi:hypothetical protein